MNNFLPRKHPGFIIRQENPFNGGPPLNLLRQSYITPAALFYVRSHGNVPVVETSSFRLEINGEGIVSQVLSLDEIRSSYPQITIPATLQCAGNRRQELTAVKPIPGEVVWGAEAIGHAHWTGVRLRDVLAVAGVKAEGEDQRHVEFTGLDDVEKENRQFHYGSSIPLRKALSPEVVLAYAMNGAPLEPVHGFPLRVVVPGYVGARCVKWLSQITVQQEPSRNYFQRKSYQLFPADIQENTADWEKGLMLGEMNLSSVICSPQENETLLSGRVRVQGYAVASGERQVARIDFSVDGGKNWIQADRLENTNVWGWCLWQADVHLVPGTYQLVVRAIDTASNSQPVGLDAVWNFKGYMNNAWHRVNIRVSG